jgi:hypothetical protein
MSGTTTTLKPKAAKRTCATKLSAANIKSSPDEDIPVRKKPGLQEASLPAILVVAADADILNASPDAGVDVAAPVASADTGGTDPVADSPMQQNGERLIAGRHQKKAKC